MSGRRLGAAAAWALAAVYLALAVQGVRARVAEAEARKTTARSGAGWVSDLLAAQAVGAEHYDKTWLAAEVMLGFWDDRTRRGAPEEADRALQKWRTRVRPGG